MDLEDRGPRRAAGDRVAIASFVVCSVLAGGNAVAVKFSNQELPPLWGATLRFALAAGILFAVVAIMRLPLPRGRALVGTLAFGALNFGGAFALGYYALVHLDAGVVGALLALTPLATLLLAVVHHQERLGLGAVVGAVLALVGVAIISGTTLGASVPTPALLAGLGSVLCFAEAAVIARSFSMPHPVVVNAVGMAAGVAVLLVSSLLAGEHIALPQRSTTWLALGYLVPFGSIAVFVLYLVLLRHWEASRAVYVDVVIPFVTVLLAVWLLDERITAALVGGGLFILAGVYVGALRARAPRVADD
jgi:drug/metabolite transporter (DMT)-like permease